LATLTCAPAPSPDPAPAPSASGQAKVEPTPTAEVDRDACSALGCQLYDTPEKAFAAVLAREPQVLALGEAHAQKGSEGIATATQRFREQLLPLMEKKASDLVIELMVADGSCKPTQDKVAQVQKPVVEQQAKTNKSEFVLLGEASDKLGIRPHVLRPSCEDYKAVVAAGDDGVAQMLTMIADLTANLVHQILERNDKQGTKKLVLAYGGALHNDVAPDKERAAWSFGPRLRERTGDHYVELDLIVPEFIQDNDSWRKMPWYPHYDRSKLGDKVVLFNPAPNSYVLVFAASQR
jgi:hypothetical protein